jgi:LEA14-like dessication related protein
MPAKKRKKVFYWIGGIILFLVAVAAFLYFYVKKKYEPPVITSTANVFVIQDKANAESKTELRIYNPNDISIRVDSIQYRLIIEGKEYLSGSKKEPFEIKANDTSKVVLPYIFKSKEYNKDFENKDSALERFETVSYIHLWEGQNIKVPYTTEQYLPLLKTLKSKMEGVSVSAFKIFKGIELEAEISLLNPNAMDMIIKGTSYKFEVGGDTWAEGSFGERFVLPKKETKTFKFPVKLKLGEVISDAGLFLSKNNDKPYKFTLNANIELENLPVPNNYSTIISEGSFQDIRQTTKQEEKKKKEDERKVEKAKD